MSNCKNNSLKLFNSSKPKLLIMAIIANNSKTIQTKLKKKRKKMKHLFRDNKSKKKWKTQL